MKECPNCKAILEDDDLFCGECGTKLETENVEAQSEEQTTPEGKKCIHCGELIEADSMFCPFCGKQQIVEEEKPKEPESVAPPKAERPQPVYPQQEQYQPERHQAKEETSFGEKMMSYAWIFILLLGLIVGMAVWYLFSGDDSGTDTIVSTDEVEQVTEVPDDDKTDEEEVESEPSSKQEFLERFYQEGRLETNYIKPRVTPEVLNRLRQAYGSDCDYGDCLGTWVFLAFPQGADARIVDGPFISETSQPGIFKVDYVYSYYKDSSKSNETRTVYLTVIKSNGDYLISDFEIQDNSPEEINSSDEDEEDSFDTTTLVGKVSDYNIHMVLNIRKAGVYGFYYYDSQGINNKVMLKGVISDGVMKLIKYDSYGKETGYYVGNFNGNTYQGKNVNYNRDEALPFSVEIVD